MTYQLDILKLETCIYSTNESDHVVALSIFCDYFNEIMNNVWSLGSIKGLSSEDKKLIEINPKLLIKRLSSRIIVDLGTLLLNINYSSNIIDEKLKQILPYKPIIAAIFGSSIELNPDHYLSLLINLHVKKNQISNAESRTFILKLSILYCLDSSFHIKDITKYFNGEEIIYMMFVLGLLSENFVGSSLSNQNKDWLLENVPSTLDRLTLKINQDSDIEYILFYLAGPYMTCTYSTLPNPHKIKESIHELIRRSFQFDSLTLLDESLETSINKYKAISINNKKVMCIIHESFTSLHAVFRCFKSLLSVFKSQYYLIGITSKKSNIDKAASQLFDEHHVVGDANYRVKIIKIIDLINEFKPAFIYYPSIGMDKLILLLSSYRLAPVQINTLGHPAPNLTKKIDLVIYHTPSLVEKSDPFVNSIGRSGYSLMSLLDSKIKVADRWKIDPSLILQSKDKLIRIAITASSYKLNYKFLSFLLQIEREIPNRVKFIFFSANNRHITFSQIRAYLENQLINFEIHPFQNYDTYLEELGSCDFFLTPFPFGNTNGLLDCFRQGLIGPCLSTYQTIASCSEVKIYQRCKLSEFIADTDEKYLQIIVELIGIKYGKNSNMINNLIKKTSPKEILNLLSFNTDEEVEYVNKQLCKEIESFYPKNAFKGFI